MQTGYGIYACIHICNYTHKHTYIYARTSRDIGTIIHPWITYAQIPNASISLIIYRGVFYSMCVCVCVCINFLIHSTYRLRLLIVPYAKASPNWNSRVLSVNEMLPSYILWHSYIQMHTYTYILPFFLAFAFSSLFLSFYSRVCDWIIP